MARILVVEDNPAVLRLMTDLLRFRGHEVLVASSVTDALGAFEGAPALALVDIEIPGGGGLELLRRVRGEARHARIPLVAVTAHDSDADRERLLGAGFDAFAPKPIDVRALPGQVDAWMTLRSDR